MNPDEMLMTTFLLLFVLVPLITGIKEVRSIDKIRPKTQTKAYEVRPIAAAKKEKIVITIRKSHPHHYSKRTQAMGGR